MDLYEAENPLVLSEIEFLNSMFMDYAGLCRNLGGKPFAVVCPPGRKTRYMRMADYMKLQLFESEKVKREDGFVLIHAGELSAWVELGVK